MRYHLRPVAATTEDPERGLDGEMEIVDEEGAAVATGFIIADLNFDPRGEGAASTIATGLRFYGEAVKS